MRKPVNNPILPADPAAIHANLPMAGDGGADGVRCPRDRIEAASQNLSAAASELAPD